MIKSTLEEFIKKAKKRNGDKCIYDKAIYVDSTTKLILICPIHGEFLQTPHNHLYGNCCRLCSNNNFKYTNEIFIEKAINKNGIFLDYSKVDYKGAHIKIILICPLHGEFLQTPHSHLNGRKCPHCAKNEKSNTKLFIIKGLKKHKGKYSYLNTIYITAIQKVIITCPIHGDFEQTPNNHLSGHGCSQCDIKIKEGIWIKSFNNDNIKTNYNLYINNILYKPDGIDINNKIIYEFYGDYWHGNPNKFNAENINIKNKRTFGELYNKTIERENKLKEAGYTLITIWEEDFNKLNKI